MKKQIAIAALLISLGLSACGGGGSGATSTPSSNNNSSLGNITSSSTIIPEEVTYATYGSYWFPQHDYKTMPVTTYNSIPPKEGAYTQNFMENEEIFKMYYDAGVNTMMGLTDYVGTHGASVEKALDYCYDYNMAYLLAYASAWNSKSESIIRSTLARVMYHDNFAGIMLVDEPGKVMFEDMAKAKSLFEKVLEGTSDKLYHCNLFPTYANQKQLWFRSYTSSDVVPDTSYNYEQYVEDYMETYKPPVLSYDFYPIQGQFPRLMNGYFENMSIIKHAAEKANVPFWTFVQTCAFSKGQRLPTEADLLWNVNTCLAYGAKGMQYFCGVNPNGNSAESFRGSMFDYDGNPTEVYYHVQKANKQLAAVDEVLMCSKSKGVVVAGFMPRLNDGTENRMTIPESDVIKSYGALKSVLSDHALVGCFDYNGKTALYVVNNAIADEEDNGITAATSVTLKFTESSAGYTVRNAVKANFAAKDTLTLDLAAGEGVLVVID